MSTLARVYELYINGDRAGGRNSLLKSMTDGNPVNELPVWMMGDRCLIRLYFRKPGAPGSSSASSELAADYSLVLSGSISGSQVSLFSVGEWVKQGGQDIYYEGTIDLFTPALISAFAAAPNENMISVGIDIEYRDAANSTRITYRADIQVCRQVYASTTLFPSTLASSYFLSPDGSCWEVGIDDNGQLKVTKVGLTEQDPNFVQISSANFQSPGGYFWELTIDDNGQPSTRRLQ